MNEEKMMILSMLENGKITSEEAIKLLEALDEAKNSSSETKFDEIKKPILNTLKDLGTDLGSALNSIIDGLKDVNINVKYNYETTSTDLELDLDGIENPILDLRAINDSITVRQTEGNKLLIKVICQYKKNLFAPGESYFEFIADGDKISFRPKYENNIAIKLDISFPVKNYDQIILHSSNGKIDLKDISAGIIKCITSNSSVNLTDSTAKEIELSTENGRIECKDTEGHIMRFSSTNSGIYLSDLISDEIDAITANGKISLTNIEGNKIICKTSNASIEAKNFSAEKVYLTTSNGKLICDGLDMEEIKEIKLYTSNNSINSDLSNLNKAAYFDLETSIGSIELNLPNLIYNTNKQPNLGFKKIVATTVDYENSDDNLKFYAITSNGSIKINQD